MTEIEDRVRRTLRANLDPIDVPHSLPPDIRLRARRGRAILIASSVLGAAVVLTMAAITIPSLGRDPRNGQDQSQVGPRPSAGPIIPRQNGRITYSVSSSIGTQLHSAMADGSKDRRIPTPPGIPWLHSWSPDGSKLAVSIFPRDEGDRTIWVMDPDGSDAHQIAAAENVSAPSWSPDGNKIIYTARTDGRSEIHVTSADGSDDEIVHAQEAEGTFAIFSAQFSPDGRQILFDRGTDVGYDIFVMDADGSNVRQLTTTGTDYDPQWAPDGSLIVFTRQEAAAESDIFVMDADGTSVQRLTHGGDESTNIYPHWSPDGTKIAYVAGTTGGPGGLVVMNADGSDPVELVSKNVLGVSWGPLP